MHAPLQEEKLCSTTSVPVPSSGTKNATTTPLSFDVHEESTMHEAVSDSGEENYPTGLRLMLVTLCLGMATFLSAIDRTIVAPAIPTITNDFHALSDGQWYPAAYALTQATFQPVWGKCFEIFHPKSTYILTVALFMMGSMVSAVARNSITLIVGRAIAGIGAAGVLLGGITVVAHLVPLHRRAAYSGGIGSLFGVATIIGPLAGGAFTTKASWRWCFYINLPLGLLTAAGIFLFCEIAVRSDIRSLKEKLEEIDYVGPLLFIPAMLCLFLAFQLAGTTYAWASRTTLGLFIGSAVLLILFGFSQHRLGERALLPRRLLTKRTVSFTSIYAFLFMAAFMIVVYYFPFYFQGVRGTTADKSSIDTLPLFITMTVMSLAGGFFVALLGYPPPVMIGAGVISAVGIGLLSTLNVNSKIGQWLSFQIIVGIGVGLNFQVRRSGVRINYESSITAIQASIPLSDVPVASGIMFFFGELGSAVFMAISQTILLNKLLPKIQRLDPTLTANDLLAAGATGLRNLVGTDLLPSVLVAYSKSLQAVFQTAAALAAVATIMPFAVEWISLRPGRTDVARAESDSKELKIAIDNNL